MTTSNVRRHVAEIVTPLLWAAPGASGAAVAARCGDHELLLASGATARDGTRPVRSDTRFEIGSLTKTFTGLLLAEMVARGEVRYDDPIGRYLPLRSDGLDRITPAHLATHTSGLPHLPPGLLLSAVPAWFSNPYRAFGPDEVLAALGRTRLRSTPGAWVRYSNYGVGVLGVVLARAGGRPFEELLADRVLRPLGLADTGCSGVDQATGYWHGRPRPPWRMPGLQSTAALRSTAADMLRYLTAHLAPHTTPLSTALAEVVRPRVAVPGSDYRLCLVWNHRARPGHALLFHSGGTRGFTSFAGFSPQAGVALVTLTNAGPTLRSTFVQRSYEALRSLAGE
ncbi:hypothetical protein ALI22I_20965 [Saccharothrix sp. ALI-22-I]|uniref:serine hydrolase domain-containing protein n=1 Tax=Saccharothrix sp. ALI-22-I TaxID=1933778 RepID=UPI00097C7976|nr:serine hydrolase domain-containing protein [Saccharothrix sp. ALI-22-I]ONI87682.1 hypothetical protein ALI22I_20965 [Saccharothrix sp. ALI-22-I]